MERPVIKRSPCRQNYRTDVNRHYSGCGVRASPSRRIELDPNNNNTTSLSAIAIRVNRCICTSRSSVTLIMIHKLIVGRRTSRKDSKLEM